jgi:hypothetical protein
MTGAVCVICSVRVGDQSKYVPGCNVATALPEISGDLPTPLLATSRMARACGRSSPPCRPGCGRFWVGGHGRFNQGCGGPLPPDGLLGSELGAGDGLHEAVDQY